VKWNIHLTIYLFPRSSIKQYCNTVLLFHVMSIFLGLGSFLFSHVEVILRALRRIVFSRTLGKELFLPCF